MDCLIGLLSLKQGFTPLMSLNDSVRPRQSAGNEGVCVYLYCVRNAWASFVSAEGSEQSEAQHGSYRGAQSHTQPERRAAHVWSVQVPADKRERERFKYTQYF